MAGKPEQLPPVNTHLEHLLFKQYLVCVSVHPPFARVYKVRVCIKCVYKVCVRVCIPDSFAVRVEVAFLTRALDDMCDLSSCRRGLVHRNHIGTTEGSHRAYGARVAGETLDDRRRFDDEKPRCSTDWRDTSTHLCAIEPRCIRIQRQKK